jgi:effector-binding domain-containing protein
LGKVLVAGVRMKGKYSDCGKGFAQLGRRFGRHICGKPMMLIYDHEYKEDDADFEPCMPVRKGESTDAIAVRELPSGRCVTLMHQGPYTELGRSYAKILDYVKQKGYEVVSPCREVYIKGPGMIFKGNPKKYLTEIQMMVKVT